MREIALLVFPICIFLINVGRRMPFRSCRWSCVAYQMLFFFVAKPKKCPFCEQLNWRSFYSHIFASFAYLVTNKNKRSSTNACLIVSGLHIRHYCECNFFFEVEHFRHICISLINLYWLLAVLKFADFHWAFYRLFITWVACSIRSAIFFFFYNFIFLREYQKCTWVCIPGHLLSNKLKMRSSSFHSTIKCLDAGLFFLFRPPSM